MSAAKFLHPIFNKIQQDAKIPLRCTPLHFCTPPGYAPAICPRGREPESGVQK